MLRILKFGGTSMGTAQAIAQSARIAARAAPHQTRSASMRGQAVVIVSAMAGVTNELIALMDLAVHERTEAVQARVRALEERHHAVWNAFVDEATGRESWDEQMAPLFEKLRLLLTGTSLVGDISDRSYALICAFGERFSSRIMQRALSRERCRCAMMDAGELIVTDAQYREAAVDFPASQRRFRSKIRPMLRRGIVPVLPGFIGAEPSGHTTLLGRGGSDYSASIAGICLHADVVEIWTDVDGIMSADPRLVKRGVRTWRKVELAAMSEMAHSGVKVLHPKTVTAAVQKKIPVIVKNTFRPSAPGTVIVPTASARPQLRGIVTQAGQVLFHFTEPGMLASSGFIQRLSSIFARHGVPIDVCATSEISFTCSIDGKDFRAGILHELEEIADVTIRRNMTKVCVIGNRIAADLRVLHRIARTLGAMPVYTVSVGSSTDNITLMVDERDASRALQILHRSLFPS